MCLPKLYVVEEQMSLQLENSTSMQCLTNSDYQVTNRSKWKELDTLWVLVTDFLTYLVLMRSFPSYRCGWSTRKNDVFGRRSMSDCTWFWQVRTDILDAWWVTPPLASLCSPSAGCGRYGLECASSTTLVVMRPYALAAYISIFCSPMHYCYPQRSTPYLLGFISQQPYFTT